MASRAKKGVTGILKLLWTMDEQSPKLFFKLFDCHIQPMLTYGSEVWGLTADHSTIERVHLFAIRRCWMWGQQRRISLFTEKQEGIHCIFAHTPAALNIGWMFQERKRTDYLWNRTKCLITCAAIIKTTGPPLFALHCTDMVLDTFGRTRAFVM